MSSSAGGVPQPSRQTIRRTTDFPPLPPPFRLRPQRTVAHLARLRCRACPVLRARRFPCHAGTYHLPDLRRSRCPDRFRGTAKGWQQPGCRFNRPRLRLPEIHQLRQQRAFRQEPHALRHPPCHRGDPPGGLRLFGRGLQGCAGHAHGRLLQHRRPLRHGADRRAGGDSRPLHLLPLSPVGRRPLRT